MLNLPCTIVASVPVGHTAWKGAHVWAKVGLGVGGKGGKLGQLGIKGMGKGEWEDRRGKNDVKTGLGARGWQPQHGIVLHR